MKAKILIVEDDLDSLKLIGLILQSKGYQVIAAQNGQQALEKASNEMPDLVILDIMMPGMSGYEVCKRMRADPQTAAIPVIMFTAKTSVEDKVAGFEAGADEYLTKPIHPAELVTRVEALLARTARLGGAARPTRRARIIGFLGCKGGVGTSTVVANVGVMLTRGPALGKKVMALELRPSGATLPLHLGLRSRGGLQNLLERPVASLSGEAIQAQMDQHSSGLLVLGGLPTPAGLLPPIQPTYAEAIVRHLGALADYLLVDLGACLDEVNRAILRLVDHVLLLVEPDRLALTLAQGMLAGLEQLDVGRHRIGVVISRRAPAAITLTKPMVENFLQRDVLGIVPPAPELAYRAADQGTPMVALQGGGVFFDQIQRLAESIASL